MLKILVPTDYSPEAKNAMLYAVQFARETGSRLVFYHAMPAMIPATEIPYENYYLDEQEEKEILSESLENLLNKHKIDHKEVKYECRVTTATSITESIQEQGREMGVDLIIMGSHGATGWRKFLLGSNTARLLAKSKIPVLAVPAHYEFGPVYHIAYASDLENLQDELNTIVPFAQFFHAVAEILYFDYAFSDSEKLLMGAEKLIRQHNYNNIKLTVKKGSLELNLAEQILEHLRFSKTQILFMFRGEHGFIDNLVMGSNSQQVVLESGIPVLVAPKKPAVDEENAEQ